MCGGGGAWMKAGNKGSERGLGLQGLLHRETEPPQFQVWNPESTGRWHKHSNGSESPLRPNVWVQFTGFALAEIYEEEQIEE